VTKAFNSPSAAFVFWLVEKWTIGRAGCWREYVRSAQYSGSQITAPLAMEF
jgi:hypothetical protein